MMGPNPCKILEVVCEKMDLKPGMRVLDLGCGKGLTSYFLAKEFGVTVYATDLWISAAENWERIKTWGMEDLMIPIHAEAHELPFADRYFDALIAIDSYHYFGANETYFPVIEKFLKPGAQIGLGFPAINRTCPIYPEHLYKVMQIDNEEWACFQTLDWWKSVFEKSNLVKDIEGQVIEEGRDIWWDWANVAAPNGFTDHLLLKEDEKDQLFNLLAFNMKLK